MRPLAGEDADAQPAKRARKGPATGARGQRKSKLARDFYARALDAAEQIQLEEAAEVEGLDQEIAVLRMKLREALSGRPEDLPLMLRGVELLVKAVSARYRLSPKSEQDLAASIGNVVRGVGGQLMPEALGDG